MRERVLVSVLLALLFVSCGNGDTTVEEDKPLITEGTPFDLDTTGNNKLVIAHHVSEYELWKASFDLAESVREKYGIETQSVYQGLIDSNLAVVVTAVEDIDTARYYVNSDKLYRAMESAGVKGEIESFYLADRLKYKKEITDTITMFMSFKVISFDRWEEAFLDDYKTQPDHDFQVMNVYQGVEDKDVVAMFFAVNDPEYVEKMEKNAAFRMKMIKSGVVSYPVIYKLSQQEI